MFEEHTRALLRPQANRAEQARSGYRHVMSIRVLRRAAIAFAYATCSCAAEPKTASIGAILSRDNETGVLLVREVSEGNAAATAGLLGGDEIIMIDGVYVRDLDTTAVRAMLRGEVGTKVHVTVVRGESVLRVAVERGALRKEQPKKPRVETIAD